MSDIHEQYNDFDSTAGPSNKNFGLTMAFVLSAISAFGRYKYDLSPNSIYALMTLAAIFLLTSLLSADRLKILNRNWTALGRLLHKIVTPLIMLVIYALVFVPIGLILKLSGKNSMLLYKSGATSFWINKSKSELPDPMKYQF